MPEKLRYLLVEDMESDAKLLAFILKRGGYDPDYERVDTAKAFTRALGKEGWDLVISDYNLPLFSGMEALRLFKESGQDIPFILVSGAVGEEIAVEVLLAGAHDFIVKGKWERLIPAIQRELQDAEIREENRGKEENLRALYELSQVKNAPDRDIADFTLNKAVELTNSRFGFLGFMKEDGSALDVHAWSRGAMKECDVKDVSIHFPLDRAGLWAEAARQRRPIVINDYPSFPHWKRGLPGGHVALANLLVVPIFDRGQAVVIIVVGNKPRDYHDSDIRQLTLLMEGMWRLKKEREAENEIKKLNQRMEFILGVTKTGIDIIDADYNIRYIDPAWGKVYGDPSGKKCFEYFMGLDEPCPGCGIHKALKTKTTTVEEQILVKEGNRPIQVTTVPFQDEEGNWLVAEANVDISERKKAEEALQKRIRMEKCLSAISRMFATHSHPDFNQVVRYLGEAVRVNRAYIFLFREGKERMNNTHEWSNGETEPQKRKLQNLDISAFPWWMERMAKGEAIVLSDVDSLPEEAAREKEILKAQSIRSLLALPISMPGREPLGFIGFDDTEKKRIWSEEDWQLLSVASEIISNYIAREKAERELWKSLREKELLLREIHHRVRNNLQIVSGLLSLQSDIVRDEKFHEVFKKCQSRIGVMAFIHEKLGHSSSLTRIESRDFIQSLASYLCETYREDRRKIDFVFETEDIQFGIDTAIPCGLIINELISNGIQHAFPGERGGKMTISLKKISGGGPELEKTKEEYELIVRDDGAGLPEDMDIRKSGAMGFYLVLNLVEKQLCGTVVVNRSRGTEFKIRFKERKYKERV